MIESKVHTAENALAYITDCTLATIQSMAMKKSRGKHEFQRQIRIAQKAIIWMKNMEVDFSGTRAEDVVNNHNGFVKLWIHAYIVGEKNDNPSY